MILQQEMVEWEECRCGKTSETKKKKNGAAGTKWNCSRKSWSGKSDATGRHVIRRRIVRKEENGIATGNHGAAGTNG